MKTYRKIIGHSRLKKNLTITLIIILTSLFFLALYRWDNKYTHPGQQAENGLMIADDFTSEYSLRFLTEDWLFYPNVLLTPKDIKNNTSARYGIYTDIGETVILGSDKSSHGSGSYIMQIKLSEKEQVYALELPEIFSAYQLYIDGQLMLQMGDPNPSSYIPLTQNRMITFEKSGTITVLIAVTDYSHFYSGLNYPPAFGTPLAVNTLRGVRLGISLTFVILALLTGLLSLYMGIRIKQKNALIFSLLCLSMCFFTSYPLVHCFPLPIFPFYALELTGGYIVTLLVIILHNRICGIGRRVRLTSNITAASFCILTFIYGLSSSVLTSDMVHYYAVLVACFKIISASYLLITSYFYLHFKESDYYPLFYATIAYATLYLCSRFMPLFEPLVGGWTAEWGSLILVVTIGCILWRDMVFGYQASLTFKEEHRHISRQLIMQTEYTQQISSQASENRKLNHDFRQHLRTISIMAENAGAGNLLNYLKQISKNIETIQNKSNAPFCSNPAVDALLQYYYDQAEKKNIESDIRFILPERIPLSDVDLCTILGNLLENALEGCDSLHDQRIIALKCKEEPSALYLVVENTYDGRIKKHNGRFLSRKSGELRMGIGLQSVYDILTRYGGTLDVYPMDHIFRVGICIPLDK